MNDLIAFFDAIQRQLDRHNQSSRRQPGVSPCKRPFQTFPALARMLIGSLLICCGRSKVIRCELCPCGCPYRRL
jgi:hypothetical protein